MQTRNGFKSGVLVGMLLMMAAQAVYWLITPDSHPEASATRIYAVIGQGLLALAIAGWLTARTKKGSGAREVL